MRVCVRVGWGVMRTESGGISERPRLQSCVRRQVFGGNSLFLCPPPLICFGSTSQLSRKVLLYPPSHLSLVFPGVPLRSLHIAPVSMLMTDI